MSTSAQKTLPKPIEDVKEILKSHRHSTHLDYTEVSFWDAEKLRDIVTEDMIKTVAQNEPFNQRIPDTRMEEFVKEIYQGRQVPAHPGATEYQGSRVCFAAAVQSGYPMERLRKFTRKIGGDNGLKYSENPKHAHADWACSDNIHDRFIKILIHFTVPKLQLGNFYEHLPYERAAPFTRITKISPCNSQKPSFTVEVHPRYLLHSADGTEQPVTKYRMVQFENHLPHKELEKMNTLFAFFWGLDKPKSDWRMQYDQVSGSEPKGMKHYVCTEFRLDANEGELPDLALPKSEIGLEEDGANT